MTIFSWSRDPRFGYECSSKGNRVFSAVNARLPNEPPYNGRTIEQVYQCDVKGYDPGGINWKLGKGKRPKRDISPEELWLEYLALWSVWARHNPNKMRFLRAQAIAHDYRLSDRFATTYINQAHALAVLLNLGHGAF